MIAEQDEPGRARPLDPDPLDGDGLAGGDDRADGDEAAESGRDRDHQDRDDTALRAAPGGISRALSAGAVVVALDQLTKWWALRTLKDDIIDVGIFDFRLIYNTGASFGLGLGYGAIIGIVALLVAIGLILYARTVPRRRSQLLLGLVAGGAIGNVIDRLFRGNPTGTEGFMRGAVVDFIDFRWWPVFNVADVAVVCGAILLVLVGARED